MKVQTRTGTDYPLQFRNYSDASRFMEWLLELEGEDEVSRRRARFASALPAGTEFRAICALPVHLRPARHSRH